MGDMGAPVSPGDTRGGTHFFHNGVWLTKGRVDRVDKYHKWAEEQARSEVERLDKEEHYSLVKLNGQCLEVRTELRGLKNERRLIHHRHRRHCSADSILDSGSAAAAAADVTATGTVTATSSVAVTKELCKSPSTGSLTSYSSSGYYSSLSSVAPSAGVGRKAGGVGDSVVVADSRGGAGGVEGLAARATAKPSSTAALKNLHRKVSASRLKSMHSARALSKLNNNMEVFSLN
ncbi:uncharacterized protein LOC143298037 [Babylonia areolata]|uniref:uncharacterized protein LOC143298037 n=1 Tax=Babylonia areolata TaxID=304850 RepID=UPI003FD3388A